MKKIISSVLLLILLSSCSQSIPINLNIFADRINEAFGEDIMDTDSIITVDKNNELISYWIPDGTEICCAVHQNKKSGVIEKYTICIKENSKNAEEITKKLLDVISKNNSYLHSSEFVQDEYKLIIYEDKRYKEENTSPTLKKEITDYNSIIK